MLVRQSLSILLESRLVQVPVFDQFIAACLSSIVTCAFDSTSLWVSF